MIKRLLIIFLIVVWANGALAQLADIGLNPMLLEGGARPLGMGGAFVAAPGDIYSLVYNPAGLAWAKGISVSSLGPQGVSFIQAYPNGNLSAFGLGVFTSKINDIPIAAGLANSNANIVSLSYATKLGFLQNVGLGITGKGLVRETLWRTGSIDQVGQGWDLDLGLLWKSDWWSVGLSGSNVLAAKTYEGGVILWDVADEEGIPALGRLGCQVKLIDDVDAPIIMDDRGLLISLELDRNRTGQAIYRAGSEWSVFKQYFFRLGFMQQWDGYRNKIIGNMTYGLGFRSNDWGIDLATYFEPIKEEHCLVLSGLYSPRDWVVVEKLDFEKPKFIMEQPIESLSLADNVVTYDDRIEIVGTVKRGVSVYINGAGVLLNDEHSFKANIPLDLGKNLIIVEARFEGEKKVWKYKVLRQAKVEVISTQQGGELEKEKKEVEALVTIGVIDLKAETEFVMESGVTRGELCSWVVKAAGLRLPAVSKDLFPDVPADHHLAPYIKVIVEKKLLLPYSDGLFRPEAYVTQEEGKAIFRSLGVKQ